MSVKYIQPIFAPNIELMRKNLESLRTFFDYYDKMGYEFQCVFGGYAATDEMWVEIERYIESRDVEGRVKSIVHRYADNYGKAYVINDLTGRYLSDAEYFLTADSDILFNINQPDMIARLVEAFEHAKKIDLNPALIALFQEEANCHILEACYQNKYYYQGSFEYEMICHPSGEGGVAGGCLFVSSEFWNKIGGYKVLGVYAADDGNLMRDAKKSGYSFLLFCTDYPMSEDQILIYPNPFLPLLNLLSTQQSFCYNHCLMSYLIYQFRVVSPLKHLLLI